MMTEEKLRQAVDRCQNIAQQLTDELERMHLRLDAVEAAIADLKPARKTSMTAEVVSHD